MSLLQVLAFLLLLPVLHLKLGSPGLIALIKEQLVP